MDNPFLTERTGWAVAAWGGFLSVLPPASVVLLYLSIIVAVLQIFVLIRKIIKGSGSDD